MILRRSRGGFNSMRIERIGGMEIIRKTQAREGISGRGEDKTRVENLHRAFHLISSIR